VIPVRVAVRIRPLSGKERQDGCEVALRVVEGRQQIALLNCDKAFTFDFAFDMFSAQSSVFNNAVDPLITQLFKGYNVTVLAYGQTGSGKTYTMGTSRSTITPSSDTQEGVIARAVDKIFAKIKDLDVHYEFKVRVAFVELYMEQLCDLLSTKADGGNNAVDIREDPKQGVYIANLTEVPIKDSEEVFQALVKGSSRRATAATNMNAVSSRSHAIFTISIEGNRRSASLSETAEADELDMPDSIRAKFHLVDLAGSERAKKTGATGERYKEGVSINMGLLSLGNVIAALGEDNGPKTHISYRDSKLTRLLQDSLGGNSHTLMIACVSPADSNIEETLNTLRYADRARKIKNKPIVNRGEAKEEVVRLRREIQDLKMQLIQGGSGGEGLNDLEAKELLDLRENYAKILRENKELTSALAAIQSHVNDQSQDSGDFDPDGDEEANPEKVAEEKQAKLATQLANLNDVLAQKEQLASTMMANEEKIAEMREKYEKSLASLQEELATLQQEKDNLDSQQKKSGSNDPTCKISEQRRKRIQDLENQMNELRKKVADQSRALKMNEKAEKRAKQLGEEISQMKANKVKLMKQMKEDAERVRVWKQAKEKEVQKLKQTERKQQVKIAKMETMHVKQQNVMKRKMEEAVIANKRLQEVIDKQKTVKKMKAQAAGSGKSGLLGAAERVKTMVNHELDVAASLKDAIRSREQLMKDRAELSKQLTDLRSQSRLTMMASDRTKMDAKRKELQSELDMRNKEIANLQKQIMDVKAGTDESSGGGGAGGSSASGGGSGKSWETIQTVSEAKVAIQYLFDKTTDLMSSATILRSEKADVQHMFSEAAANVRTLEDEITQLKQEKETEVLRLTKEFEDQKSMLLSKLTNPDFDVKEADMAKFSEFHSKLKETMKKKKKKPAAKAETEVAAAADDIEDIFSDEESEGSDDDAMDAYDPDWQQTPLFRRLKKARDTTFKLGGRASMAVGGALRRKTSSTVALLAENSGEESDSINAANADGAPAAIKRKSNSNPDGCGCKNGCKNKKCSCRKNERSCGSGCKCGKNGVSCTNNKDVIAEDVEDCTAGTMSLLSATFDLSDAKENDPPAAAAAAADATFTASSKAPALTLTAPPSKSPRSPAAFLAPATPLSSLCTPVNGGGGAAAHKRKTIFQSPLSETNESPTQFKPRPLVKHLNA